MVVIFYGGNILVGKAINDLPPFTIAFFRLFIALLVLLPIGWKSAWHYRSVFVTHRWPFLMMTLSGITFFNTFIYGALQYTTATNVSVLETVIPVVTVILSVFLLKEKLRNVQWIGIVLSFFGAIWVVLDGRILALTSMNWNIGDGIMVGAIFSWSIYSICVKKYMHLFPAYGSLLVMTGISVLVLLPVVGIEWMIRGVPSFNGAVHIASLFYLGIFPSFIALLFFNRAVDILGPSKASVFLNFLPVVTVIGAYFWLGETITTMKIIGAVLVICGVFITTQFGDKMQEGEEFDTIPS
ncbi:DMT family transporter [Gracilibacillus caseinilyticus]|uniref:DMT family transporter n=1 Tax=Gracilibacillus caseinilyticus TaxID=2932256 RepID=A0ABY4EVY8_9BACI|nr:DMT family transporter [Gracilibacillus caseinilyticus]UOQ48565.1 DMT family transporter [Gracilibacillus caseinilyticus]